MPIDPQRWRMPLLLLLLGATATSFWWLPPLLDWVHDYGDDVQGLQALIQLVLSGMTLVLLIARPPDAAAATAAAQAEERRGLAILCAKVTQEVTERLGASLYRQTLIALGREETPDALALPWARELERPGLPARPVPTDTTTLALFEQGGGALLILGEPGAGKTVELLTLAQGLLNRPLPADDPSDPPPVPVPLNLSTWASRRLPLADWIADELFRRHQIPRAIGAHWLARGRLLPLLDGLDEVAEPHRADCAAAIDAFHRADSLTPLAVCCRVAEYRALPPLALNTAIHLLPLDRGQLERYLRGAGPALAGLRQAMAAAPLLAKLAATPLMLNVMSLTWQERPAAAILAGLGASLGAPAGAETDASPAPADEARDALFAAYLARVFSRKPDQPGLWSPAYTRRTLAWLAARMQHHGRTLFQIEDLQGDWGRWWVQLPVALVVWVLYGFAGGGLTGLTGWWLTGAAPNLIGGAILSAGGGAFLGAFGFWTGRRSPVDPGEQFSWSWAAFRRSAPTEVPVWLAAGAVGAASLGWLYGGADRALQGLVVGAVLGIACGLLFAGISSRIAGQRNRPNLGYRTSLRNGLRLGALGVPFVLLVGWLSVWLLPPDSPVLLPRDWASAARLAIIGFVAGFLFFGGSAALWHYALRLGLWLEGRLPLRLAAFLDHGVRLILLQRVGGGWVFIHRLLQEHLAATAPPR